MQKVHLNITHGGFLKYGRSPVVPGALVPCFASNSESCFPDLEHQYLSYWPEKARFFWGKSFQSVFLWEIHEIYWNMMFVFVGGCGGYHSDLTSPESEKFSEIWCWARQFLYHQQTFWISPAKVLDQSNPTRHLKKIKRKKYFVFIYVHGV